MWKLLWNWAVNRGSENLRNVIEMSKFLWVGCGALDLETAASEDLEGERNMFLEMRKWFLVI